MNRYLIVSFLLIVSFIILAVLVSPRTNQGIGDSTIINRDDKYTFLQINDSHYKPFDQFMMLLTKYGREVVWTLTALSLFIFGGWTGRKASVVMAIVMIILIPIGMVAKEAVARPRPIVPDNDVLMPADNEFAYPSGHAVIVSAGAAVMLALYRNSYRKLIVSIGLTVEAALVCFSRVYVGGHYPLDVVGGIMLGVSVAFIFVAATKRVEQFLQPVEKALKKFASNSSDAA